MRRLLGIILVVALIGLVRLLDNPLGPLPPLGRFIDPVNGCFANAEAENNDFTANLNLPAMQKPARVWYDDRLVAHVNAANEHDLYYLQGYIHATFRLWQMDMQTRAAAGRISEVAGAKALDYDRLQRRKGMIFAAENSLRMMESDGRTFAMMNAYTDGVNAYIAKLKYRDIPLEYKLMGFYPEQWTNLKSALLLKLMADDLTGSVDDIPLTYLREVLSPDVFQMLYPESISGSDPVIPHGTGFTTPSLAIPQMPRDTVFPHFTKNDFGEAREDGVGSNNWAVSGSRTGSGAAILCNDPHLGLNLPALWYEMQLQAPGLNVYGVSLPGAPGIILGFNDSVAWGFTNNYRDVKDYYLLRRVEGAENRYWLDGERKDFTTRIERIVVKGEKDFTDTVQYSVHGPVTFDEHYPAPGGLAKPLAMCWMAHRASNELLAVYLMNRATDYTSFGTGISNFLCPAQNIAYADRQGNVAIWGQGQFVNKWKGQGKFIMDGSKSATLWQSLIPIGENPHVFNPPQGFVASANECVTDSTYPYWYNGDFVEFRAWRINQLLKELPKASIEDMFHVQNDDYSILASRLLPLITKHISEFRNEKEKQRFQKLAGWNFHLDANAVEASIFQVWWYYFYNKAWAGFSNVPALHYPSPERTLQLLELIDSTHAIIPQLGNLKDVANISFRQAMDSLSRAEKSGLEWYKVKNTTIRHLTKLPAFSFSNLKIGGWGNTVNAAKSNHGPSWRLVVEMGKDIQAFGIYPGGQSGNPGSKYYGTFVHQWADGKYYWLNFLPNQLKQDPKVIKYTWTVNK